MSNNSTDAARKVGNESTGVDPLMFMNSALMKELQVRKAKIEICILNVLK